MPRSNWIASALILALTATTVSQANAGKPQPPPPPAPQLVGVVWADLEGGSCTAFVGVDSSGRVLVSQCYATGFVLAAQLPGVPVSLHHPGAGSSWLYVGMANGDIYALPDTRAQRPWNFIYQGNVFTVAGAASGTITQPMNFAPVQSATPAATQDDMPPPVAPGAVE